MAKWGLTLTITKKLGQVLKPSENGTSFLEVILNVQVQFYSGGIFVIKWSNCIFKHLEESFDVEVFDNNIENYLEDKPHVVK